MFWLVFVDMIWIKSAHAPLSAQLPNQPLPCNDQFVTEVSPLTRSTGDFVPKENIISLPSLSHCGMQAHNRNPLVWFPTNFAHGTPCCI
jgi:hypothetical protein